jgi:lipopolysaccharide transport system ATP-binding protein
MSDVAICVQDLGKLYRIGTQQRTPCRSLRDAVTDALHVPLRAVGRQPNGHQAAETIWALKDVSFDVKHGQVVGIVGRNGAGKSTLLKILSRITEPTSGRARIHGRVGSLLEVGTGFHPELTGRENIYLNGAILGMRKAEIDRKFDEIVAFAEIEKFLDTPVKHYSSGMYVRLAFAVAAHLEPHVLIVDEVLAVGDAAFQKKCLGRMGRVASEGRTVLFVSHNMLAVQSLCSEAIWLRDGQIAQHGKPDEVVPTYLATFCPTSTEQLWADPTRAPGNDQVRIRRAHIQPVDGSPTHPITVRTPIVIEFEFWNLVPDAYLNLSLVLLNQLEQPIFNTTSVCEPLWHGRPFPRGLFRSQCYIPGDLLNDGTHRVQLHVIKDQSLGIFRYDDILSFEVQDATDIPRLWYGKIPGAVRPSLAWRTELVQADDLASTSV